MLKPIRPTSLTNLAQDARAQLGAEGRSLEHGRLFAAATTGNRSHGGPLGDGLTGSYRKGGRLVRKRPAGRTANTTRARTNGSVFVWCLSTTR